MKVGSSKKPYDDINITPMLDLAYVLLVIFIIMTTAAVQGIKVQLPTASATQSLNEAKTRVIAVDTNVLVYAHREDSPQHDRALECVNRLAEGAARWAIPWPCIHEFLAVVTHPRIFARSMERLGEHARAGGPYAMYEAALLVENGSYRMFQALVVARGPGSPPRRPARGRSR